MMIEFCGNCKLGEETKDIYPGTCPYYKKAPGKHCANHRPLPYRPNDGRMVYIASAMRGDIEGNLKKAAAYCQAAAESGAIPIAPHLIKTFKNFLKKALTVSDSHDTINNAREINF